MWVFCLYVLGAFRSQKSTSDPPELVLQTVVNSRPLEEQVLLTTNHLSSPCFISCVYVAHTCHSSNPRVTLCTCGSHTPQFLAHVLSHVCVCCTRATVLSFLHDLRIKGQVCLFESGSHYIVLAVWKLSSKPDLPLPQKAVRKLILINNFLLESSSTFSVISGLLIWIV